MKSIQLLFIGCFLFINQFLRSADTDSLQNAYPTMPHNEHRLATLSEIIRIEQNNPNCIRFADILLKEAVKQNNNKYISLCSYYHLIYYYNQNKQDSVGKWLSFMIPYVEKSREWNCYFEGKRYQIELYTQDARFELAISEATKMKQKAQEKNISHGIIAAEQCLGNVYVSSSRIKEGADCFEKAYKLLSANSNEPLSKISVLLQLISANSKLNNSEKELKYIQKLDQLITDYTQSNPSMRNGLASVIFYKEICYARYYLDTKQVQKAYTYLLNAKKYFSQNTYYMYNVLYYDVYADYYRSIYEYQIASSYIDTTLVLLNKYDTNSYAAQLHKKAQIRSEAGNSKEAYVLYRKALEIKDSEAMRVANMQMEQIKTNFDLERLELEQAKLDNELRLIFPVVATIILIALSIFSYRIHKVRKALRLSEREVCNATKVTRETNEMKNRFLSNMSYNIRTPLNNVVGFSQLIANESDMDDELRNEYSGIILKSTEILMKLVNSVLDLSRLESGMMKFQIQRYDMVQLCNEAIYMARRQNGSNGISILYTSEIESLFIHTDTNRLAQALVSTLTYPCEYKQEREIRFILKYSEDKQMICCHITNSPLIDTIFSSQETAIQNEINAMLLKHFGGEYNCRTSNLRISEISFSYPVKEKSE